MARALFLIIMIQPSCAFALDPSGTELIPMSLKVMGALTLVLGLVLLLYALLKKSGRWIPTGQNREINLIEVRYLAPKRALYLIEVNGTRLLLSGTGERMESLAQWPAQPQKTETFENLLNESVQPVAAETLESSE